MNQAPDTSASSAVTEWGRLRHAGEGDGIRDVPSTSGEAETGYGPVRYALGPSGEARLLVPCAVDTRLRDLGAEQLEIALVSYSLNDRSSTFIDLTCLSRQLEPVFAELASDISRRLYGGAPPARAVHGGIQDFRALLKEEAEPEVPLEKLIGVLGELIVLQQICEVDLDGVDAWTGPYDQRHDFRQGVSAFEVKTSSRADATKVSINGIEQLLPPQGGDLTLVHVRMERSAAGELSLESLRDKLLATGVDMSALDDRLAQLDCPDPLAAEWNRVKFHLEGVAAYEVVPGFPRIVRTSFAGDTLPPSVSGISYDIHLDQAAQWKLGKDQFTSAIRRLLS